MAALDSLPLEILLMILAHLDVLDTDEFEPPDAHFCYSRQKEDQPSWYSLALQPLVSLCLVSKRLCYTIQPILYREFMLGYGDSWRSELYTWDGRLLSFLRTIARRRDLAAFVERIHILPHLLQASVEALERAEKEAEKERQRIFEERRAQGWRPVPEVEITPEMLEACRCGYGVSIPPQPKLRSPILEEEARDTLHEVAAALTIEHPERLSAKDLITLLIAALPNLKHCSLFFGPDSDMIAVHSATLSAAGISQLPLRTINLSVLRLSETFFDFDRSARALLNVSPGLETLNLHKCCGYPQVMLPSLPSLKSLRITCSRLNEQSLEALLNSCDSLCDFTYEAGKYPRSIGEELWDCRDHFQLRNAARYLSRHHQTLESVHIDLRSRGGYPATPTSFDFRDLTALKQLFLNLDEFHSRFFLHQEKEDPQLLVRILPSSIHTLHLAGHIGEDLPRLEKGLLGLGEAVLKGQFQNLMEVRWDKSGRLEAEDTVRSLLTDAGVDFAYDSWPETGTSFYNHRDVIPIANFEHPFPLPDEEDHDL